MNGFISAAEFAHVSGRERVEHGTAGGYIHIPENLDLWLVISRA